MASCIRGLVAIKDSQIYALTEERDELNREIAEKKKIEYRHLYQLGELQRENNEILAKMEACQVKYRKLKEEKEDIRQNLLVKTAADKITHSYINKLKVRVKTLFRLHNLCGTHCVAILRECPPSGLPPLPSVCRAATAKEKYHLSTLSVCTEASLLPPVCRAPLPTR